LRIKIFGDSFAYGGLGNMATANNRTGGRVIQGFFPGGRPNIIQASSPTSPRPVGLQSAPARPGIVPPINPHFPTPIRHGAVQPKAGPSLPGKPSGPILPTRPGAVQQSGLLRPGMAPAVALMPRHGPVPPHAVQPASRPGQPFTPPKPTLPSPPRPATVQPSGGNAFALPAAFALRPAGMGQRLPEAVQRKMESFFKADFSGVRVHVGPEASSIGAFAFTRGTDLYFAPGQYNPQSPRGQRLLGHELTHVVQQRAGRVRNSLGSGIAVIQDQALEAEAETMGQQAAAHAVTAQAKKAFPERAATPGARHVSLPAIARPAASPDITRGAAQRSTSVNVSGMMPVGNGRYRIVMGARGQQIGSVMVHNHGESGIEVTDLAVDPSHRKRGLGGVLMASAARAGNQLGKTRITLASRDSGTGRLTVWYKNMGFSQVGVNKLGYQVLEAPIRRVLSNVAQRRMVSDHSASAASVPDTSASLFSAPLLIQKMEAIAEIEPVEDQPTTYLTAMGLTLAELDPRSDEQQINPAFDPPRGNMAASSLAAWNASRNRLHDSFVGVTDLSTLIHYMFPSFQCKVTRTDRGNERVYTNGTTSENLIGEVTDRITRASEIPIYGKHFISVDKTGNALGGNSGIQHLTVAQRVQVGPGRFIGWSIVGTANPGSKPEVRYVSGRNEIKFKGRRLSFGTAGDRPGDRDKRDMPTKWREWLEEDLSRILDLRLVQVGKRTGHDQQIGRKSDFSTHRQTRVTEACNLRDDRNVDNVLVILPANTNVQVFRWKKRWFRLSGFSLPREHFWVKYLAHEGWVRSGAIE
jgi:ribosomal protein S18 acetylase RimI-like enzyme